ncbi:hypothetical protein BDV93DRAFT_558438 [Ceratobasidium sp. AG-I]|nr:hypothetical protein BDV93DRAFT_558438 [Ceratobasidium sp. AG-I]
MAQVLMGAPPVMLRSAYAEPFFAWSSFKGMRAYHSRRYFSAALYFASTTSFRTNGILLSGFILYDLIARPVLAETISTISKATRTTSRSAFKAFLRATRHISPLDTVYSLFLTVLVLLPFVAHQYAAYATFCIEPTATTTDSLYPRPWCASRRPLIYGFVQSHYWDIGFLRYWTIAQIPNFLIAAPMLVLVGGSSAWFLWLAVGVFGKRAGGEGRVNSSKSNSVEGSFLSPVMVLMLLPYALHALALSMIPFTSAHVQIALHVLPAATPWAAWVGAALIIKGTQINQLNEPFVVDGSSEGGGRVKPDGKTEDGSAGPGGVGAAAVVMIDGRLERAIGKRLGEENEHSALDAELAGILLAAHLIVAAPNVDYATIFTDSQTALSCIRGTATGATQSLLKSVNRMISRARARDGGTTVLLKWCPGHSSTRGSDLADAEAKAAARGKAYPPGLLPRTLVHYRPPRNHLTFKAALKERNRELAKAH